jgi:glycosyltransferase involved in cell wall biosynthesis
MIGFEENEISTKAHGGTEITKRTLAKFVDDQLASEFQIIPSRVRELNEEKIRVYWQHDLAEDPEVNHLKEENSRNRFHKFVFSSNWQLQEFVTKLGMPMNEKIQVIETPIEPLEERSKDSEKVNLIYFSTPQRGLELLYPVVEELAKKHPHIHLDVFSSFKIYGWDDADKQFEPLYEKFRNHPNMTYHGFANQQVLREHLLNAHILAYPNIWKETSCRVLMESMSAGLMCVHPNLGALPDTSGGLTSMYQFNDNVNKHANLFYNYLDHAIQNVNKPEVQRYLRFVKTYADSRFSIGKISSQWDGMLRDLVEEYPTVESRKIPGKMFVYKTT